MAEGRQRRNVQRNFSLGDLGRGKKTWSSDEDNMLMNLVKQFGTGNWSLLASSLAPRTGKQVRLDVG